MIATRYICGSGTHCVHGRLLTGETCDECAIWNAYERGEVDGDAVRAAARERPEQAHAVLRNTSTVYVCAATGEEKGE